MALRLRNELEWKSFLTNAGIPDSPSTLYAKTFVANQLNEQTVLQLTAEHLEKMDINVLGDQLAILQHIASLVAPTTDHTSHNSAAFKPPPASIKMPSIVPDMTNQQFRKFVIDWNVYKQMTGLPPSQIGPHLYNACNDTVQHNLVNSHSTFFEMDESAMLEVIEKIVTKSVNPAVHRMHFGNLMQSEGESIKDFLVRIRSLDVDCEFSCPACKTDISSINIKDQFICGLHSKTLQTDILAKAAQLKTIDDIVKHAEAFETALHDQSQLHSSAEAHAARASSLRKRRQQQQQQHQACSGCGSNTHGIVGTPPRHSHCPAWGKLCDTCKKPNHFAPVCRKSTATASSLVAHVHYDSNIDAFTSPENIEEIKAEISPQVPNSHTVTLDIFPDSGANICLAGVRHLQQMGLHPSQLCQCHKHVKAVGGSILICKGWIPATFKIEGYTTTQPLYICEKVDRLYFSRQGCLAVNILSHNYPRQMPKPAVQSLQTNSASPVLYPSVPTIRPPPPSRPDKLPYPALPENIPKLENYIREKFANSVFNNKAPFPALTGPAAKIHLKPTAVPYARHTPTPIPHHWKAQVKASLDRDVERGIIKPVPIGTVTWCSPMVVVSKADRTPHRTIDFQRLNAQCLRETHHTASPFQLASQVPPNTKKSVLDAVDGFHSVPLDSESQPLTTFITEWGRYMCLRMPQGYSAAGDAYTCRYDEIIEGVERKVKIINDTLLYDESIEQHFYHVWDYLTLSAKNGIIIHAKKFSFAKTLSILLALPSQLMVSSLPKRCYLPSLTFLLLLTSQVHVHGLAL